MTAESLILNDFRNYKEQKFEFSDGVNVIFGLNAQGKTNIIEALFLCAIGGSFRTSHTMEMVRRDAEAFSVELSLKGDITDKIKYTCDKKNKKSIKVNGIYLKKIGELMGSCLAVLFSPEDLQFVTEGPSLRRRFLDIGLSQQKPSYFYDLTQYNKILAQKMSLIKKVKYANDGNISRDDQVNFDLWNHQLAAAGSRVIFERLCFLKKLQEEAGAKHAEFSAEKEDLALNYDSFLDENAEYTSAEEIFKPFETKLNGTIKKEIEREACLTGPHRDDIIIKINGMDLKKFGSQGQKRTAVLAVKMGELEIMKKDTGRTPILLLDDVLSELDQTRQRILLSSSKNVQTFITCTDRKKVHISDVDCAYFNIKNGSLFAKSVTK